MQGAGTTNRKFQSGKVAKKTAQQISAAKALAENEPDSVEALQTKAIMTEYREKRGLTLMEQHLEKQGKSGTSSSGANKRKSFDRDEVRI